MSTSSSTQANVNQPPPEHMEATAQRLEAELMALDVPSEEDVDLLPPAMFTYEPEEDTVSDLSVAAVKTVQGWSFEEVRTFLDERPMSLYLEFFDIVDGRILSVLTDDMLQELGVNKRLHRLVLINKIAKEKARSQHHALIQAVLVRMIQALREGRNSSAEEDQKANSLSAHQRKVQDILSCFSVQELGFELRAKLKAGGAMCEVLLFVFSQIFMPKIFSNDSRLLMFADPEASRLIVRRLRRKQPLSDYSCANALRALFVMLRNDENRAAASNEGAITAVISVMERAEATTGNSAIVFILSLLILMSLAYTVANQTALVKNNGIRAVVRALAARPDCIRTQEYGFRLLWLLAQDPLNHDTIIEHGSVATIIAGMAAHRRRAGVQEHGCGLIRSLCFKSANKGKIIAEGGIGAVVKGMVEHGDHPGVQEHGSAALRLMSAGAEISKTLKGHTSLLKSTIATSASSVSSTAGAAASTAAGSAAASPATT